FRWDFGESAGGDMDFEITNGQYVITIVNPGGALNGGEDRWDCQFRHRGLTLQSGCTYEIAYEITASNDCTYYTKIGDMAEPFDEDWHGNPDDSQYDSYWGVQSLTANQTVSFQGTFTATRTAEVEWAFHIGGDSVPIGTVFTFDNMSLICVDNDTYDYVADDDWVRTEIVTNQVGYFTNGQKRATLISDETDSVSFSLLDEKGNEVYVSSSDPQGYDADSGDNVHILDFSEVTQTGTFTLKAGDAESREITIGDTETYSGLLYDSLNYFYQNRSGIAIESQYITSGDANTLARAAGHTNDVARITTDWDDLNSNGGTQDVSGGWYDAGDHGKYVVNGGISLWMMQNQYERSITNVTEAAYADGTMSIPENTNGYPDLLDEARWEMEWMLKMIVQDGEYEGMVYHKMHDIKWTALGLSPADDTEERIIKPPTTCATLNLAACAAQAARLWDDLDPEFSETCLKAAEEAYEAAQEHPNLYAPLDQSIGGGAYGDDDATDEFYWAACELYLTTGNKNYLEDMEDSEHYLSVPTILSSGEDINTTGSFDWGNTAALGTLSLAINNTDLASETTNAICTAADIHLDREASQGYGQPITQSTLSYADSDTGYVWGSNSFVADNAIIMAYAYDLTNEQKYLDGVISAVNYLLGNNPMDISYVTGYGTHAVANPHHRYWASQISEEFPSAPAGVLVGGPNSGMQDPWVQGSGWVKGEIAPAKCYMDNIEAWSVNECTINWNAPLAWITGFVCNENGGIIIDATSGAMEQLEESGNTTSAETKNNTSTTESNIITSSSDENNTDTNDFTNFFIPLVLVLAAIFVVTVAIEVVVYKIVKSKKK
ncbi:MAG: glycoside hydrolase family 9 protein, partial [Ruminococcus sp.]|nr:glycoside hydrolase family 9 protein [Ruminococcus sp.]